MTVHKAIKTKLREAGITELQVAEKLKTSRQNICQDLNGKTSSFAIFLDIAESVGLKCKIVEQGGGAQVLESARLVETARDEHISAETLERLLDILGWKIVFDWQ